jgi:hypothetical protein
VSFAVSVKISVIRGIWFECHWHRTRKLSVRRRAPGWFEVLSHHFVVDAVYHAEGRL